MFAAINWDVFYLREAYQKETTAFHRASRWEDERKQETLKQEDELPGQFVEYSSSSNLLICLILVLTSGITGAGFFLSICFAFTITFSTSSIPTGVLGLNLIWLFSADTNSMV